MYKNMGEPKTLHIRSPEKISVTFPFHCQSITPARNPHFISKTFLDII
jgi:hypothetical protein